MTDYDPDRLIFDSLARQGWFIVAVTYYEHCHFTDGSLRKPTRRLLRTSLNRIAIFATQQSAEACIEEQYKEDEDDREYDYKLVKPLLVSEVEWLGAIITFVQEYGNFSREDAMKWVYRNRETLAPRQAEGLAPAIVAAEFMRDGNLNGFDYAAWADEHMLHRPLEIVGAIAAPADRLDDIEMPF